ncbi:MAG: glycosyltransferase [Desulfovibrio sp.]|nr:glycosyltransferase [Desulfovibrio sp.]MCA1985932.1 glycosyltransferase [Desulfovibrio sp.]
MHVWILTWMVACGLALAVPASLWLLGRRVVPAGHPARAAQHRPAWPAHTPPRAALIIPMTGESPHMAPALASLLAQDYPDHIILLVTQDEADPATTLAQRLVQTHAHARHVLAGPATACGQKTHNQLAALAALDTMAPPVSLLAFCDASHAAQPNFLSCLLEPLVCGRARVAAGYHLVTPEDARLPTLGQTVVVLALHALQAVPRLRQPWGGAMAMTRRAFDDLQVAALWGENVVDDVSLAARLVQRREPVALAPAACLRTPLAQSWTGWTAWLTRQLAYPRFIMPGTWLGIGLGLAALTTILVAAVLTSLAGLAGVTTPATALTALAFVAGLLWTIHGLAGLLPQRPAALPWYGACLLTLPVACWCLVRSAATRTMRWRHRAYIVGRGGRVERILED